MRPGLDGSVSEVADLGFSLARITFVRTESRNRVAGLLVAVTIAAVTLAGCGSSAVGPVASLPPSVKPTHVLPTTPTTAPAVTTTSAPATFPATPPSVGVFGPVTAIGDSVMLDALPDLQLDIPGITVNAAVSRQFVAGEALLAQLKADDQLGNTVVVGLGTNGPVTSADFDNMMSILADVPRVVFVTVHVDRPWQDEVNQVLYSGVMAYPNAVIADWATLAAGNPEWFGSDGTHLGIGGIGAQALAQLITTACEHIDTVAAA